MNQINSKSATLLSEILEENSGKTFYSFANAEGKRWIMPVKNMVTAMNLYQPSGIKGKMVKSFFPYLSWFGVVRKFLHADKIKCSLRKDLYEILCEKLGVKNLEFSIFGGTPCVHQKITIQFSIGNRILGYCKICRNEEIYSLFESESKVLAQLQDKGIKNIPQCLYCGRLNDGIGLFLQSTIKTNHSAVIHQWTDLQENFLKDLYVKTKKQIRFEDSDFYKSLILLQQHLDWLPESVNENIVDSAIEKVLTKCSNRMVEYAAYHADFTPWNMFVEKNNLFVFDFEYAQLTYPPMLDKYHFFSQIANFERHWSAEQMIDYMQTKEGAWIKREEFSLYLLDVMSRFTVREKRKVEGDVVHSFAIWIKLLEYCIK